MYQLIIVEDEDNIRQGLTHLFPWSEISFHVAADFNNGRDALAFLETNQVDAILTDIRLPHIDGIELAHAIYESKRPISVVFLTGYRDFEYAQQAVRYGVRDLLLKPVKYNELIRSFLAIKERLDTTQQAAEIPPNETHAEGYYDRIIKSAMLYVSNNLRDVMLEDAAVAANLSSGYFSRLFHEKVGMTFSDYCMRARMEYAAELLKNGDYKTYEIADLVGYDNPKNFSRAFKQYHHITPRECKESRMN